MTMPHERTRAVVQTGEFLAELVRDRTLPYRVRHKAKFLLRHYPSRFVVLLAGRIEEEGGAIPELAGPIFSSSLEAPTPTARQPAVDDEVAVITFKAPGRVMREIKVNLTDGFGQAILEILDQTTDEAIRLMRKRSVSRQPKSSQTLQELVMLAQAQTDLLNSGDWISASEVGALAQLPSESNHPQLEEWKSSGLIFCLHHLGTDYFPMYGLDTKNSYQPLTGLAPVIAVLTPIGDGWRIAYWFNTPSSVLGGLRPKDLIQLAPQEVLEAAEAERSDIMPN